MKQSEAKKALATVLQGALTRGRAEQRAMARKASPRRYRIARDVLTGRLVMVGRISRRAK